MDQNALMARVNQLVQNIVADYNHYLGTVFALKSISIHTIEVPAIAELQHFFTQLDFVYTAQLDDFTQVLPVLVTACYDQDDDWRDAIITASVTRQNQVIKLRQKPSVVQPCII